MISAVVKLGGSTAFDLRLQQWLDALSAATVPLVVVPGGGPFAEQVRQAQKQMGFSDHAAHAMAILAMDQFGYALADRGARFVLASTADQMARAHSRGLVPVWLPSRMTESRRDIPVSWDVTSDSLAAWLAGEVGAKTLLLVKQTPDVSVADDLESISRKGIVDPCLARMLPAHIELLVAGPQHAREARQALSYGTLPGIRIGTPRLQEVQDREWPNYRHPAGHGS